TADRSPPATAAGDWHSVGDSVLHSIGAGEIHPVVIEYAIIGDAYRANDRSLFNEHLDRMTNWFAKEQPNATRRTSFEFLFNRLEPFTQSMTLYVLAFLLACASWLGWSQALRRSAFYLLLLALAIHTFGLFSRMYLQERPPVTNLYSSAIFIGWGAVIVALILERIFKDGIGAACAGAIGFVTLIIAHHLAGSGDTLEMLQAVLDTNIWLATHVVAITTGYSAMFLAGMLAIIYVVRMIGVGLHSYGFMEKAFPWLVGFMISQLALMAIAAMPLEKWRSFASARAPSRGEQPQISPAPSAG